MVLSRRARLAEILRRLAVAAPFATGAEALAVLHQIVRDVEDEYSGIPEDPNAHLATTSDGRMYGPHDRFEFRSGSPRIRAWGQTGHRTFIGDNGAMRIDRRADDSSEIELPGADGKTVTDLRMDAQNEAN
jgi:hypothetical protein